MRRLLLPVTLCLALLSAGCAESMGETVGQLRGDGGLPDPYYREYRQDVGADHNQSYLAPVNGGAVALQVDLDLNPKAANGPLPPAASLTVALLDPNGEVLVTRLVDPRTPNVSLGLTQFAQTGDYSVRVAGEGFGQDALGLETGAFYDLRIEIVYA